MNKAISRFDWVPLVLLVLAIALTLAGDLYQSAMLLSGLILVTIAYLLFLLNFRNRLRRIYSLSFLVLTILIFYGVITYDPFNIFEEIYLILSLIVLPLIYIFLGFIGLDGSFTHRMRRNLTYIVSIVAVSYGHFIVVAIASGGV